MPLQEKIRSGKFVVLGEFEPPKGTDFSSLSDSALIIRGRVDAIVVPEMANAVLKASSLGACAFYQKQGIETVLQVCCRDRNRLALQADILAAGALDITNIMAVAGEEIKFGDHPQARTVNDLDLTELLDTRIKIIPTVMLLKSAGMARYIDRNVKGVSIPSEMIRGIQKAPDKTSECIRIAGDMISRIKEIGMAGVLVSTIGWEKYLPQVLDEAKI
jgi:5,10-methylenetetrahydrofolate reductase